MNSTRSRSCSPADGDGKNACAKDSSSSAEAQREQILMWLTQAMRDNAGDAYPGKRDQKRFRDEFELEAVLVLENEQPQLLATMHNICETGVAFWVRTELDIGRSLFLRTSDGEESAIWVEVKVSHCTRGIRGFIVGASFAHPVTGCVPQMPESTDQQSDSAQGKDSQGDDDGPGGLLGWLGLRK